MAIKQLLLFSLGVAAIVSIPLILIATIPPAGPASTSETGSPGWVVALETGPPQNPGGPTMHLTLRNELGGPISNISAVLDLQQMYTFSFPNVTAASPLPVGGLTSTSSILIGASYTCGAEYALVIRGAYSGEHPFSVSVAHVITCE